VSVPATPSPAALPLDGYVRVSRVGDRGGEGFISPEIQEQAILDWGERNGHPVLMHRHELNVSGGTMDRPVFNEIMERVRNRESGGIVVYKTDRFARSLLGAVTTLAELGKHGAAFASVSEPELDYSTPAGQAFLHMLFVFAEFVRATIKESWATSQRMAVERGIHISPTDYLGYEKGDDGRLRPNGQAPIAVEVFERRGIEHEGWGQIANWLNEAAPKAKGQWNGAAIQRLCANRVYRGEASRYVKQNVDNRDPIVNRDAHPALVPEELWQAAQMVPLGVGRSLAPGQLLSGLVRCAGCRYRMSKGKGPRGEDLYRCRANHASGRCPEPAAIKLDALDEYVEGVILAELDTAATLMPDTDGREQAVRALAEAQAALDDFRRDTAARRKLGAAWHEWLDVYLGNVREAQVELDRINNLTAMASSESVAREHYLGLPIDERRQVLGGFLDAVIVRRSRGRGRNVDPTADRTRILWRGEAPANLPRQRVANIIEPFDFGEGDVETGIAAAEAAA
jgi:DNA invertase Pin-like site-specific DNA recombinase